MKKYIVLLAIAAVLATSCDDDFLTRVPESKMAPENYFQTATDLQMFSNSFYNNLLDKDYEEHKSDQYIGYTVPDLLHGGSYRTVPNSGGGWTWTDLRKLNTMLAYIDNCKDEAAVKQYTGVCLFFRTFIYFERLRKFGDLPWIDHEVGSTETEVLMAPRDSRETILGHMIEDIDKAIEYLPADVSTFRVNKWSALALKSEVCLFEGTFRKYHKDPAPFATSYTAADGSTHDYKYYLDLAADAAKQVIDGGKYKLYSTGKPDQDYRDLFAAENATASEYILAIHFSYADGIKNNTCAYALLNTQGRAGATKKIVDSYLCKDGSRFTDKPGWETMQWKDEMSNRDPRLAQTVRCPGYIRIGEKIVSTPDFGASVTGYQIVKFVMEAGSNSGMCDRVDMSSNDLPVYRYGQVLLNYAEAKAEAGTLTQSDVDISIKLLRDRAGMPNLDIAAAKAKPDPYLTNPLYGYTNPILLADPNLGVILEVRRERAVEMAQEGEDRYFSLIRWKEGKCIEQNFYGMYFPAPGDYDLDGDGKVDICLYEGKVKPSTSAAVAYSIGTDIILSDGNKGYVDPVSQKSSVYARSFDENRDYFYPIPINERSLNPNLKQNPGWNDGLDF